GAWHFTPASGEVDTSKALDLTPALAMVGAEGATGTNPALAGRTVRLEAANAHSYLFIGQGSLAAPKVGD
ncbi:hypothetical protein ACSTHW_23345, partial [Vibrio parahaemolyticus]